MLQLLTCSKGHSWEAAAADDGGAVGRAVCPVCGDAVDLMPLFDLAPSAEAVTTTPEPLLPQAPPLRDTAGKPVVAGFEIQQDLGRSPLGVHLYRAKQLLVNRTVLLKVVVAREDSGQSGWGALRGEASALGRLTHPNIVQMLEAGERERQLFYNAVEWVDGPTLAEHAAGKPLPPRQAARLVEVLARAVHSAHEQGQVHRCLRPACIRLQPLPDGGDKKRKSELIEPPFWTAGASRCLPRIGDFGLARRPVEGDAADVELYEDQPSYLAPEQAWGRSREIGAISDVYALGAILYELLAGKPPFRGRTSGETLDLIRHGDPPSQLRAGLAMPVDLAFICRKAMARHPRNRYKTALELADDLRAFTSLRQAKARQANFVDRGILWIRRRPTAAALLLVCFLAACGWETAYLLGAGEAAASKISEDSARTRAAAAESREGSLRKEVAHLHEQEQGWAYYHRILLADSAWRAGDDARARRLLAECPAELRHWEWHYLDHRLDPLAASQFLSLTGSDQPISCIAYSPDGRQLAAASGARPANADDAPSQEVRIWALPSPTTDHVLNQFRGPIRQIAFSPDGKRLATGESVRNDLGPHYGGVKEWDALQNLEVSSHRLNGEAIDLAYSPDGKRLIAVDEGGKVAAYPSGSPGEIALNPPGAANWQKRPVRLAVLNPEGTKVALANLDGASVRIYDTQRMFAPMQGALHADEILALAFNAEANLLASASRDGTIQIWDVQQNRLLSTLHGHTLAATGVSFTRDGRRLATASDDGIVCIWDPISGQEILRLTPFDKDALGGNAVTAVQFSPAKDDWQLAAAHGNEVRIFGPLRP
jgi:eukaryotic-like serine/threonine-protein kinase